MSKKRRRPGRGRGRGPGDQFSPESASGLRTQLLAGVQEISKVLTAAARKFSFAEGVGRVIVEEFERNAIEDALAQAAGAMSVLLTVLGQQPEPAVGPQLENLAQLWHLLVHLAEAAQQFQASDEQRQPLNEAFKLLGQCAAEGSEEKGQQGVRTVLVTLEPPSKVRSTLMQKHTKNSASVRDPQLSELQLHPISMGFMVVYRRIGLLHCFVQKV